MLNKQTNKTKHGLLKAAALLIALCYLMEPAQNELHRVFHFISHNLQPPSYVLQHNTKESQRLLKDSTSSLTNHDHKILDIFYNIFNSGSNASNLPGKLKSETWSAKKIVVKYKYEDLSNNLIGVSQTDNFKIITCLKDKGYALQLNKPPQLLG